MKKIFLLMTIMTSLFFALSINSNAYTFNGSYDFSNVDLDLALTELNGASLNDLFDYDYFEHLYLAELPNGVRSKFELNNGNVVFHQYVQEYVFNPDDISQIISSDNDMDGFGFYYSSTFTDAVFGTSGINGSTYIDGKYEVSSANRLDGNFIDGYYWGSSFAYVIYAKGTTLQQARDDLEDTKFYYELSTPIVNTDIEQSLLFWNLENINIDLLNYYFAVWILNVFNLPVGDLWAYAWTAGNDAGYNDGFNEGYDSGYTTGFDTGNLQGYTSGYDFGYNTGFDDGIVSEVDTQWLLGFVTGTVNVLGVSIIPGISLGVFVFIPLFLGFIGFIFRLGGRRG